MGFHDIRFPANLSFGAIGGPERRAEIVELANGFEERNSPWSQSRRRYDAGSGLRSLDDVAEMVGFFEARRGQLHGFRWKDWSDYKSCPPSRPVGAMDQQLGKGDGERKIFHLVKDYGDRAHSFERIIHKPIVGTVKVAIAGDPLREGVDWSVNGASGEITFMDAPVPGAIVSAGFEFDVAVRFDTDRIITSMSSFQAGEIPSVPVVEIRL